MTATESPFTITWVLMEDVIDEVKATGVTDHKEAVRRAQKIWNNVCFLPEMYITDRGDKEATRAEFVQEWLQRGYTWEACIDHLETLRASSGSSRRQLPQLSETKKRVKASLAKTYTPTC